MEVELGYIYYYYRIVPFIKEGCRPADSKKVATPRDSRTPELSSNINQLFVKARGISKRG